MAEAASRESIADIAERQGVFCHLRTGSSHTPYKTPIDSQVFTVCNVAAIHHEQTVATFLVYAADKVWCGFELKGKSLLKEQLKAFGISLAEEWRLF
ncbi:MAG: hypothetical protein MJY50_04370 [Bacteroidales bacterium]|nr:hypothetical protein [Bacteroidales bacterium]